MGDLFKLKTIKAFIIEYSETEGIFRVEPVWMETMEEKDFYSPPRPITTAGVAMVNKYTLLRNTTNPVSTCSITKPFNCLYHDVLSGYYMLAKTESETVRDAIGIFFHYYESMKGEQS